MHDRSLGWVASAPDGLPLPRGFRSFPGAGPQAAPRSPPPRRGRSRPSPAQAPQRSAGAMARGALLGAVACLCFLAPAAEAFKRRGPSVTAKVTLARGGGGVRRRKASGRVGRGPRLRCPAARMCREEPAGLCPAPLPHRPRAASRAPRARAGLGLTPELHRFNRLAWLGGWFLIPLRMPPFCRLWHTVEFGPA